MLFCSERWPAAHQALRLGGHGRVLRVRQEPPLDCRRAHRGTSEGPLEGHPLGLRAREEPLEEPPCRFRTHMAQFDVEVRATWPDQRIIRGTLADIAAQMDDAINRTALILVGSALNGETEVRSALYATDYDRRYRPQSADSPFSSIDED